MSALFRRRSFTLSPQELADASAVIHDRFQSPRARKRARALLMLSEKSPLEQVARQTTLSSPMLEAMLVRFEKEGLRGAIFGVERHRDKRRYDVNAIADVLMKLTRSRPTAGIYWSLRALTEAVEQADPGMAGISEESVRMVLVKKLGIRSVRHIEPFWLQKDKRAETA